jgi:hypothetical protein
MLSECDSSTYRGVFPNFGPYTTTVFITIIFANSKAITFGYSVGTHALTTRYDAHIAVPVSLLSNSARAIPSATSGNKDHSEEDGNEGEEAFLKLFVSLLLVH